MEIRIGQITTFTQGCKVELKKAISDKKKEILAYFTESCSFPLGTRWGPDATVIVTIDGDNSKLEFEPILPPEGYHGPQPHLPIGATWLDWQKLCCDRLFGAVSFEGSNVPMAEAKGVIDKIIKGPNAEDEKPSMYDSPVTPNSVGKDIIDSGYNSSLFDSTITFGSGVVTTTPRPLPPGVKKAIKETLTKVLGDDTKKVKKTKKLVFKASDFLTLHDPDAKVLFNELVGAKLQAANLKFPMFNLILFASLVVVVNNRAGQYAKPRADNCILSFYATELNNGGLWRFNLYNDEKIIIKKKKEKQKEVPPSPEG